MSDTKNPGVAQTSRPVRLFPAVLCGRRGGAFVLLLGWFFCAPPAAAQTKNGCLDCHALFDPPLQVTAEQFARDFHAQKGLDCTACHGGDATTTDMERAKSRAAGFRGKIARAQIPRMCAECHSNAAYMRGFDPSVRTDQYSQYLTSVHGMRLARGDTNVAVCTDCHGTHGIRPGSDTRSSVHPLNVAATCARCHSDAARMGPYGVPAGQAEDYQASVHHQALSVRGDLSAPTCSTCHGTHGAAPPGVQSVEFVCSTCHAFQAQLFDTSPHKPAFTALGLPACVTCHSNHRVEPTSDAMLGTGADSLCVTCHSDGDAGYGAAGEIHGMLRGLEQAIGEAHGWLARAEQSGMEVSAAQLELGGARDALTKARVAIHAFQPASVAAETEAGMKIAADAQEAGRGALAERDYRRIGLAISLVLVLLVLFSLWRYIRKMESAPGPQGPGP